MERAYKNSKVTYNDTYKLINYNWIITTLTLNFLAENKNGPFINYMLDSCYYLQVPISTQYSLVLVGLSFNNSKIHLFYVFHSGWSLQNH